MKFWKKLLYYLLGVGLGTIMVMFIFGDRNIQCSYFPNDRVLYDLRKKELTIPAEIESRMQAMALDTADINRMLLSGKVHFKESDTQKDSCKTYWISYKPDGKERFKALLENCADKATLQKVKAVSE